MKSVRLEPVAPIKCKIPEFGAFASVVVIGARVKGSDFLLQCRVTSRKNRTLQVGQIFYIEPNRVTFRNSNQSLQPHQWKDLLK